MFSKLLLEPTCNEISVNTIRDGVNKNKSHYKNIFGEYDFKFFDWNGFAVYEGTVNGRNTYIYKNNEDKWMVKLILI